MRHIEALQKYWGYQHFRPLQEEIITSILQKYDTLALLPTGGGKSLCYQIPAVCLDGVAIVISPLIALMNDQLASLEKRGIKAAALTSQLSRREWISVLDKCAEMDLKLLYISPERLQNPLLQEKIRQLPVSFIAVDEAHCISQWGHDFRPAYRQIATLREILLPQVALLALTATATQEVIDDIRQNLKFRPEYKVFKKSFHRPNLSYNIRIVENKLDKLIETLRKVPGSAIVFMRYRLKTIYIANILNAHGISADFYHAGLTSDQRREKQELWMQEKIRVIAATNAFGMGIDKPNVRLVIHLDPVPSLEEYFQEAGRAGRDEKKAYAVTFISPADLETLADPSHFYFPAQEELAHGYQTLFEYLRIPVHQGQGEKFPFSIHKFSEYAKTTRAKCYEWIRWFEREGHISFDDQCLRQSKVRFYFDYYQAMERYSSHPHVISVIQTILRLYEGVRYTQVDIDEGKIATLSETDESTVVRTLFHLSRTEDADYYPKNTDGFLTVLLPRMERSAFTLNQEDYTLRKNRHFARHSAIRAFYQSSAECRVIHLLKYLGEDMHQPCGLCDYCRDRARRPDTSPPLHHLLRKDSEAESINRDQQGKLFRKK